MESDARAFIKSQLEAGNTYDMIRREMISQGFSTAGFDAAYTELTAELGIVPAQTATPAQPLSFVNGTRVGTQSAPAPLPFVQPLRIAFVSVRLYFSLILIVTILMVGVLTLFTPALLFVGSLYIPVWGVLLLDCVLLVLASALVVIPLLGLMYTIALSDKAVTFAKGIQWSTAHIFSIIWLQALLVAIVFTATVAAVIPAVLFAFLSVFSMIALMREDERGIMAIVRSTDLMRVRFWTGSGQVIILALVAFVIGSTGVLAAMGIDALLVAIQLPQLQVVVVGTLLFFWIVAKAFFTGGLMSLYRAAAKERVLFEARAYTGFIWMYRLAAVAGIGMCMAVLVYTDQGAVITETISSSLITEKYRTEMMDKIDQSVIEADGFVVKRRLDTMFNAGLLHKQRLTSFEGVCRDVLIEKPVRCQNTDTTFVLDAPIGTDRYYCRDSSGFAGEISTPARSAQACR